MGNRAGKIKHCFAGDVSRRHDLPAGMFSDEGLGHSFCYIRPDPDRISPSSSKVHSEEDSSSSFAAKTFRSISGASVSANTSTPPSTALFDICNNNNNCDRASAFESSTSFASIPLQPVPRSSGFSGGGFSGPMERGFLSGPIERGFVSGPIDIGLCSGPIDKVSERQMHRSVSLTGVDVKSGRKFKKQGVIKSLRRAISSTISRGGKSLVSSFKGVKGIDFGRSAENVGVCSSAVSGDFSLVDCDGGGDHDGDFSMKSQNLQWAQGKAGEDRVHIVISEKYGWVFVGIYDGFNGPDAPDYLLSNLYNAVHEELKGLLWNERFESSNTSTITSSNSEDVSYSSEDIDQPCIVSPVAEKGCPLVNGDVDVKSDLSRMQGIKSRRTSSSPVRKREENQMRWKGEWNRDRMELERKLNEQLNTQSSNGMAAINHDDVLNALAEALRKTEDAYLDMADKMVTVNPELALMGSCVLAMLMKGEDIYLMNVGDSRAVLAQKAVPDLGYGKMHQDLGRIKEESLGDLEESDADGFNSVKDLATVQLTVDHSSYVEEEVLRIKNEHLDDASAILNDRVKGYLKVTRAFGAGFLKQPKWNDALLEMFRIDYVGTSSYINCEPYIYHHRLGPRDRFLILSSDGLYQYFTNEEAVAEVESFISSFPEGDPAQHLIEEVLFRAAKKAGMDFHELIDIPQGDRRRYHDDVSIIIISFEGRIWRSSV